MRLGVQIVTVLLLVIIVALIMNVVLSVGEMLLDIGIGSNLCYGIKNY